MAKKRGRPKADRPRLKPTSIKMDPELKAQLQRIAEEENRTMSRQVVHWVREKIAEYGTKKAS